MDGDKQELMSYMQHKRVQGSIVLVLLLLAVFLAVKSVGEIKAYRFIGGGVPVSNTITVQGEGEVVAPPDLATFSFAVIEQRETVEEAQTEATQKINVALELVRNAGIEEKDIKTTAYNIFPRYEFQRFPCTPFSCPPGKSELVGYEVSQTVSVKVRDIEKAGEILAEVGSVGVSNVSNLQLTIDEQDDLERDARAMAIDDAKKKAKDLAKDLDVRLVRIVNFSESGRQPIFRTFDAAIESAEFGLGGGIPDIPTGENEIISRVSITYEVR